MILVVSHTTHALRILVNTLDMEHALDVAVQHLAPRILAHKKGRKGPWIEDPEQFKEMKENYEESIKDIETNAREFLRENCWFDKLEVYT